MNNEESSKKNRFYGRKVFPRKERSLINENCSLVKYILNGNVDKGRRRREEKFESFSLENLTNLNN